MSAPRGVGRWLVTGAGGMLGMDLRLALAGREVTAATRRDLDITHPGSVREAVTGHDVVVNCAAWTAVDAAEEQEAAAFAVNAVGAANLALACRRSGAWLVHMSTDYVFGGDATEPYPEDAPLAPVSAYGRTKAAGEWAVRAYLPERSYIVRTAWLYGEHGPNFVRTMIKKALAGHPVEVVDDQRGQPTWSRDLAERVVAMVDHGLAPGIYHGTASGDVTWLGLARHIFAALMRDPTRVAPTSSSRYARPARRPPYSVLGHAGWHKTTLGPMRSWREALDQALPRVRNNS